MKLSIITVNLNNRDGLQKTIDSVVGQTFRDFEWIIIDGGSTDGSKELIEKYSDHFAYWVSEPDKGIYNAMNKGIVKSSGEYIIFMNSGDCFANIYVIEETVTLLDCDIVAGYVIESTTNLRKNPPIKLTPFLLLDQNIPHQAEFIRRDLFSIVSLYSEDLKILADFEFNIRASLQNCSYKVLHKQIAIVESGGISNTMNDTINSETQIIKNRNIPNAILDDYAVLRGQLDIVNKPCIQWAVKCKWPLKIISILHRMFDNNHL